MAAQSALETRAGVHTGEVELRGADVGGFAVHVGQRVCAAAGPGEVLSLATTLFARESPARKCSIETCGAATAVFAPGIGL